MREAQSGHSISPIPEVGVKSWKSTRPFAIVQTDAVPEIDAIDEGLIATEDYDSAKSHTVVESQSVTESQTGTDSHSAVGYNTVSEDENAPRSALALRDCK